MKFSITPLKPGALVLLTVLGLVACRDQAPPPEPQTPIQVEGSTLQFDPATVMRGSAGTSWGLGSYRVWILGRANGQCVFELFDEVEGGYGYYLCRVATDGPPVRIYEENGGIARSFDLEKATLLSQGNHLLDLSDSVSRSLSWEQRSVPDTDFVIPVADLEVGTGPDAGAGDQVSLKVTVFTNEQLDTPLVGFEPGHLLQFDPGEGVAGPALELALAGMKQGGTRLAKVREEIGGLLDEVFGPFNPGTLLVVKLELEAVE